MEFFPYFLLGVYYKELKNGVKETVSEHLRKHRRLSVLTGARGQAMLRAFLMAGLLVLIGLLVWFISRHGGYQFRRLYGPFARNYGWQFRKDIGAALMWLLFFPRGKLE